MKQTKFSYVFALLLVVLGSLSHPVLSVDTEDDYGDVRQKGFFGAVGLGAVSGESELENSDTKAKFSSSGTSSSVSGQLGYTFPVGEAQFIRPSFFMSLINMENMEGNEADIEFHGGLQFDLGHKISKSFSIHGILLLSSLSRNIGAIHPTEGYAYEEKISPAFLGYGLGIEKQLKSNYSIVGEYITQTVTGIMDSLPYNTETSISEFTIKLSRKF